MAKDINVFIISMSDNEISKAYTNTAITSLKFNGYNPIIHEATTPKDMNYGDNYLYFGKLDSNGGKREFSSTEKAVWNSHFNVWKKVYESLEPAIILEHDVLLANKVKDYYDHITVVGYRQKNDKPYPASGAGLWLQPYDALSLMQIANSGPIKIQVDGFIQQVMDPDFDPCFLNYVYDDNTTIIHKEDD